MDANSAKLLKQLKQYNKAMEKYERSKRATQTRQFRKLGDLDKKREKLLTQAGLDVPALLQEAQESAKILSDAQQAALALEAPPTFPGKFIEHLPDPNVLDVRPPAVDGLLQLSNDYPENTECGFNLAAGQIHFKSSAYGEGFGITGDVVSSAVMTLVFQFTPPRAGPVQVDAYVDLHGQFAITVFNHWWNSPEAFLRLSVASRLYQDHWAWGPKLTVLHEERNSTSSISGWIDPRLWRLSYTANLRADATVLVFVETTCEILTTARQTYVDVYFNGPQRWIGVPAIFFTYL